MLARLALLTILLLAPSFPASAAEAREVVVVKGKSVTEEEAARERRERVMNRIETVRIARMTEELDLDPADAERLFPAIRPFNERRADATRSRGAAGKVIKEELQKGEPDPAVLAEALDRFAAAQKAFDEAGEEEYVVLRKLLDPVTLARYYQFQREFEGAVRGLLQEFREDGNPGREKREKWEKRQRMWDQQNREDRQNR